MKKRNLLKNGLSLLLCLALLVGLLSGATLVVRAAEDGLQIHFIDVGQADAALVICEGKTMLIDGGNAADSQIMYSYMQKMNVKHLDYVIGTHPHEDHIGGIPGALQYVSSIGTAYCSVTSYTGSAFPKFVTAVQNHGVRLQVPTVGTSFTLGGAQCRILAVNTPSDDINDSSIVMRITYGQRSFLFTGDAETPVEQFLLNSNETLKSDVLKVGHHGSSSSTGYRFLREVDPDYAVIGVGANNEYGHPTEAVLSRLRDADVKTYRTDIHGDVICTSDGSSLNFTVSRNENADPFGGIGDNSSGTAPSDPKQIVDEAYALAAGASLPYIATLTGKITRINQVYDPDYDNITVTMVIAGRENYPIQCYRMQGTGIEKLEVGDTVTVRGSITNYVSYSGSSTIEFSKPTLLSYTSGDFTVPTDPKQIVDAAYALGPNEYLSYEATLTGKVTKIHYPYDSSSGTVTVTMVVAGREDYPLQCYRMTGDGVDLLQVGNIITVRGMLYHYYHYSGTSTIEFDRPSLISYEQDASVTTPDAVISDTPATAVSANKPYKLIMDRNGTKYYFTGEPSGNYLASSTDPQNAVTVYLEGSAGSYRIYFMNGSSKTYIRLYEQTDGTANAGKPGLQLTTSAPSETYHFDTALKTLVYTPDADNSYYVGTYSSFTNFSASNIRYVSGSNFANVDVSQFPARLYAVQENETAVSQWNVSLKENIRINFTMNLSQDVLDDPDAWVSVTQGDYEEKIPVSQAKDGIRVELAASQMTEKIGICVVSGDGTRGPVAYYSVRQYADYILSGSYAEATKELVRAMLCYGGAAQVYFGHNTQELADAGITLDQQHTIPPYSVQPLSVTGEAEGITASGASLILVSATHLRIYFDVQGSIDDYSFTQNGQTLTPVKKDGSYYVQLPGLLPRQLDRQMTVQVQDRQGNSLQITYGPLNYIIRRYQSTQSQPLKNLLQALYTYHITAMNYPL